MKTALAYILILIATFYLLVACTAFEFRNPKANRAMLLVHLADVLAFRALPQFQE